jgi:hypothetical protein
MNRITAFTDVEFDEHAAVRRRVNRSFGPAELSVEQQSYNEYKRDARKAEDRLDLAENEDALEEFTGVALAVLAWVAVFGLIAWFTS